MALLRSLLLLFMCFPMQNEAGPLVFLWNLCVDNWIKDGQQCFKYFSEPVDFLTAQARCVGRGGSLASVHSQPQNYVLIGMISPSSRCWIGGYNSVSTPNGPWSWTDGSPWDFSKWCPGEPNNNDGDEHCVELNFSSNRCWNDVPCSLKIGYMCARPF